MNAKALRVGIIIIFFIIILLLLLSQLSKGMS